MGTSVQSQAHSVRMKNPRKPPAPQRLDTKSSVYKDRGVKIEDVTSIKPQPVDDFDSDYSDGIVPDNLEIKKKLGQTDRTAQK